LSAVYSNLMGYTTRRPKGLPALDRAAVMRDAHRIAKACRSHFGSYHEALAYGLRAAWLSAKSRRQIQSLAIQAGRPAIPFTATQIEASRRATRRCGASLSAS
jgi:hypothetical protein